MTTTSTATATATGSGDPVVLPGPPLTALDALLTAQVEGVTAWVQALHEAEAAAAATGLSREERLDAARRLQVRQREREVLQQRVADDPVGPLATRVPLRAVVVHRHAWTRSALARGLAEQGLELLHVGDDAADALGTAVAEQPSVVVLEESLLRRSGPELARELRRFCPRTLLAAHVGRAEAVAPLREAGVHVVRTRGVTPEDLAAELARLLGSG